MKNPNGDNKKETHPLESKLKKLDKLFTDYIFPTFDEFVKMYMKDKSERQKLTKDGETNLYSGMTQKSVDALHASLQDAKIGYGVTPTDMKSKEKVSATRRFLDYIFESSGGGAILSENALSNILFGWSWLMPTWEKYEEKVSRISEGKKKDIVVSSVNRPSMVNISPYHVLFDITCTDTKETDLFVDSFLSKCDLEKEISMAAAKGMREPEVDATGPEEEGEGENEREDSLEMSEQAKWYQEYQSVMEGKKGKDVKCEISRTDRSLIFQNLWLMVLQSMRGSSWTGSGLGLEDTNGNLLSARTNFNLPDYKQGGVIKKGGQMIEENDEDTVRMTICYHTDGTRSFLVNGVYVGTDDDVVFTGQRPKQTFYKKLPNCPLGIGVPQTIIDSQKLDNMVRNLGMDSAKIYGVPAFKRLKAALQSDFYDGDETLDIYPGKVFDVSEMDDLQPLIMGGQSSLSILAQKAIEVDGEMKEDVGLNEYVLGSQGKVERSAQAVRVLVESFRMRMRPLVSSINAVMAEIAKQWVVSTIAWGDDEFLISSPGGEQVVEMSVSDIMGQFLFSFNITGLTSITRELERDAIMKLMPFLTQLFYDPKTGEEIVSPKKLVELVLSSFEGDLQQILGYDTETGAAQEIKPEQILQELYGSIAQGQEQQGAPEGAPMPEGAPVENPQEGMIRQMMQGMPQSEPTQAAGPPMQ
jgi:hypothetical protein